MGLIQRFLLGNRVDDDLQVGLFLKNDGTVWLRNPDGSETQVAGGGGGASTVSATLSSSALNHLHSAPISLIDAPGAGRAIKLLTSVGILRLGTIGYPVPGGSVKMGWVKDGSFVANWVNVLDYNDIIGPYLAFASSGDLLEKAQVLVEDCGIGIISPSDPDTAGSDGIDSSACTINDGGSGYVAGDQISIDGGNGDALAVVTAVDGGGAVISLTLGYDETSAQWGATGSGYSTATAVTTEGGSGSGLLVDIGAVGDPDCEFKISLTYEIVDLS